MVSEILHKQTDHGMCEVFLANGVKCDMNQAGFEYIVELENLLGKIAWEACHDSPQERGVTIKCIQGLLEGVKPIAPTKD